MLRSYKRQYQNLPSDHHRELGHFFNTMSAVLDTIGSMTENSILCSIRFDNNKEPTSTILTGGRMDNAPQLKIPPTDINLSRYMAFFPDYQLDNGNVLKPNPTFGAAIFSSDYPPHPDVQKLHENSALPMEDKEYSMDDNSTTDESVVFSSDNDGESSSDSEKAMCRQKGGAFAPHPTPTQNTMSSFLRLSLFF